eukprot:GCRY01000547.1.p1 GENE.GCRY01000547.1~~GCRY01000547.1.p1  ORF type:complete len:273 (+),score=25.36 GCRY01000547.1:100-819(+)
MANTFFGNQSLNFNKETLLNFSTISSSTQKYLKEVYLTLTYTFAASVFGVYLATQVNVGGFMSTLAALGCLFYVYSTPPQYNNNNRLYALLAFGALKGISLHPLLAIVSLNLVYQALFYTTVVFGCFSLAALYAQRRSYLFLGGILGSALNFMFWSSIFNMFFGSRIVFDINLYLGLVVFCGFVVYDTQIIIERGSNPATRDAIRAATELYIDFIAIFVRIIAILASRQKENDNRRRRR